MTGVLRAWAGAASLDHFVFDSGFWPFGDGNGWIRLQILPVWGLGRRAREP